MIINVEGVRGSERRRLLGKLGDTTVVGAEHVQVYWAPDGTLNIVCEGRNVLQFRKTQHIGITGSQTFLPADPAF